MDCLNKAVKLSIFIGLAPVRKVMHPRKGVQYKLCKIGLLKHALHVANLLMMVIMFSWYIKRKQYYHPLRLFQENVLMYTEVAQVCSAVVCSLLFRLRGWPSYLTRCTAVAHDLDGCPLPHVVRHCAPLALAAHTLVTLYRVRGSIQRPKLMIFFWIGMNYEIIVNVMIFTSLFLVDKSISNVNKDLKVILSQRIRENSKFLQTLGSQLNERYFRACSLRVSVEEMFGPDVLCGSFFFIFKISFHFYHVYYRKNFNTFGQNTLVGELTGFMLMTQLLLTIFLLAYLCDDISKKRDECYIYLLTILKSRICNGDAEFKNIIKVFLLEVKSRRINFDVCKHFTFNRESLYNMILEAITYVYTLIQLHGLAAE